MASARPVTPSIKNSRASDRTSKNQAPWSSRKSTKVSIHLPSGIFSSVSQSKDYPPEGMGGPVGPPTGRTDGGGCAACAVAGRAGRSARGPAPC